MAMTQAVSTLGAQLKLSEAEVGKLLAGVDGSAMLRYDLPIDRAGQSAVQPESELDHRPGNLRIRVLEANDLPVRPDGTPCQPFATVTVAELTRRRTRKCSAAGAGPSVEWDDCFDFEETSACAQVVIDVWDQSADGAKTDLLGKAVMSLSDCRNGVPHTYFKNLLEGTLVRQGAVTTAPRVASTRGLMRRGAWGNVTGARVSTPTRRRPPCARRRCGCSLASTSCPMRTSSSGSSTPRSPRTTNERARGAGGPLAGGGPTGALSVCLTAQPRLGRERREGSSRRWADSCCSCWP